MGYYELIKKETLTEEEYKKLYELMQDDIVYVKYSIKQINKIKNRLRYIPKSAFFQYFWCPFSFKLRRILDVKVEDNIVMKQGRNTHRALYSFWDVLDYDQVIQFEFRDQLRDYIYDLLVFVSEKVGLNNYILELFKIFSEWLSKRVKNYILKFGTEEAKKYIYPVYREVKVENKLLGLSGILDAIFLLPDGTYLIVDYKTGKPKYYELSKYSKFDIEFELIYYKILIGDGAMEVIDLDGKLFLKKMEFLDISRGCILFLEDPDKTDIMIDLKNPELEIKFMEVYGKLVDAIDKNKFWIRKSSNCIRYCQFFHNICSKKKPWLLKFAGVKKEIREAFEIIDRM